MKNEIITRAINDAFYKLCTDHELFKDMNFGAATEAISIAFDLDTIDAEELSYLYKAAREAYLSH